MNTKVRQIYSVLKRLSFGPSLTKRQKIVIATIFITIGLVSTQLVNPFVLRYRAILGLGVVAYLLSLWALWEGMSRLKAVVLLILPTMFAVAVASFYFLLPIRWLTRLPVAIIFGLSFYSLLLAQNVFNVAAVRTIPLYRAASTAAYLFTLITAFFLYNVVFSLHLPFYLNGVAAGVISFPLALQLLWSIEMEKITSSITVCSLIVALMIGECAAALSFWPVAPTIWSLALSTTMYVLLGIILELLRERLNKKVVWEFLSVGVVVLIFSILATSWTG